MRRGKAGQGHEKIERDVGSCLSTEKRGKENKTKMKGSMKYLVINKTEEENIRKTEQQIDNLVRNLFLITIYSGSYILK